MNRLRLPTALLAAILLAGCGARSGCPDDFAEFGRTEALRGDKPSLPGPTCKPDEAERSAYFAGRGSGIVEFCSGRRMFDEARLGRLPSIGICPLDRAEDALAAQRTGDELRKAQERMAEANARGRELEQAGDTQGASEAGLRLQAAQSDLEQLRALAITRGWLANPASSGILPPPPGNAVMAPAAPIPAAPIEPTEPVAEPDRER